MRDAAPPPQSSSFLPPRGPWGQAPQQPYAPAYNPPPYNPMPQGYEPVPPQDRPGFFSGNSGLGSFLRNAGTTAAGVAGGEMLFSGLSNLFGGHHGGGFLGGGGAPEEVVVNNFISDDGYDDDGDPDDRSGW